MLRNARICPAVAVAAAMSVTAPVVTVCLYDPVASNLMALPHAQSECGCLLRGTIAVANRNLGREPHECVEPLLVLLASRDVPRLILRSRRQVLRPLGALDRPQTHELVENLGLGNRGVVDVERMQVDLDGAIRLVDQPTALIFAMIDRQDVEPAVVLRLDVL